MKAIEINGEIKTFSRVPKTWKDDNGVHLNFDKVENPQDYSFFDVVMPTYDSRIEELDNLHLDGNVYTYNVVDKTIPQTLAELKSQKISNLNHSISSELSKTDWYVVRYADVGTEIPAAIKEARADLREQSDIVKAEINALTTKKSVLTYDLPNFMI
jgi:hypothetical protein